MEGETQYKCFVLSIDPDGGGDVRQRFLFIIAGAGRGHNRDVSLGVLILLDGETIQVDVSL